MERTSGIPISSRFLLALFGFLFIFLSGCALNVPASEKLTGSDMTIAKFGDPAITDPNDPRSLICQPLDDPQPCYCMFCENRTSWFGNIWRAATLSVWYDTTLYGGKCGFEHCNITDLMYEISTEDDDLQTRTMMVGTGPSFVSADSGNRYCNYSLQIATRWMKGNEFELPRMPGPSRAKCWLDHNTLPIYMYYTGGKNIDPGWIGDMAEVMQDGGPFLSSFGVGPVMIATEVALNSSDDSQISAVKGQIDAIDSNCDDCLIILSVYGNKTERELALTKILKDTANQNGFSQYYDKVDVVGFGFLANDYSVCGPAEVIGENYLFSRFVLKNYSKPTIWLYAGASVGNNTFQTCYWNEEKVHNFYQTIFATSQAMASSGIMGVSFYEFVDYTGPLPCNSSKQGCAYGFLNHSGAQKHPQLNSWSSMCQYFGTEQHRSPLIFSRNGYGSVCGPLQMENNRMFKATSTEFNTNLGLSYDEVAQMDKEDWLQCGEICVSDTAMARPQIYDEMNHIMYGQGNPCEDYPEIEELSDEAEFSSLYMRAVISQESSFNPFAMSCVPKSNNGCNRQDLTAAQICDKAGDPPGCPRDKCTGNNEKPCAMGLGQCIEMPGDPTVTGWGCHQPGASYNPFAPADSICCGINKMTNGLVRAKQWVDDHETELSACAGQGGYSPDEYGWLTYYLASLEYYGADYNPGWIWNAFLAQRDPDPNNPCTGTYVDFIDYLRETKGCTYDPNCFDYSANVMSRYLDGTSKCDSDCPGKLVPNP